MWVFFLDLCHRQRNLYKSSMYFTIAVPMAAIYYQARFQEIPIAGGFVTRLDVCAVAQTPHIYKKLSKLRTIEGANISWRLSLTVE